MIDPTPVKLSFSPQNKHCSLTHPGPGLVRAQPWPQLRGPRPPSWPRPSEARAPPGSSPGHCCNPQTACGSTRNTPATPHRLVRTLSASCDHVCITWLTRPVPGDWGDASNQGGQDNVDQEQESRPGHFLEDSECNHGHWIILTLWAQSGVILEYWALTGWPGQCCMANCTDTGYHEDNRHDFITSNNSLLCHFKNIVDFLTFV